MYETKQEILDRIQSYKDKAEELNEQKRKIFEKVNVARSEYIKAVKEEAESKGFKEGASVRVNRKDINHPGRNFKINKTKIRSIYLDTDEKEDVVRVIVYPFDPFPGEARLVHWPRLDEIKLHKNL